MPIAIIDFYVDEPTCLGVPPFFSPYPRYIAGALRQSGLDESDILYFSIDHLRRSGLNRSSFAEINQTSFPLREQLASCEAFFILGGSTVPGKYLATKIGSLQELKQFLKILKIINKKAMVFLGGAFAYPSLLTEDFSANAFLIQGDLEKVASLYAQKYGQNRSLSFTDINQASVRRSIEETAQWSMLGAFITRSSLFFPHLIQEIETYRGCSRSRFCSFCTEKFFGKVQFREVSHIVEESAALLEQGNHYFRLGKQSDILTFRSKLIHFEHSFPRPEPSELKSLYRGIAAQKGIKLLHLDNMNPGTVFYFPRESRQILETIVEYNSSGDTAALGLESLDEIVIEKNFLKISPSQALEVIRIIHEIGHARKDGMPALLPGINLIHGLIGENRKTFQKNYEFLLEVKNRGWLLRRINIRQAIAFANTSLYSHIAERKKGGDLTNSQSQHEEPIFKNYIQDPYLQNRFRFYKTKIRQDIDQYMLKQIFPIGSIIKNVIIEKEEESYVLGRPLSSYPITCKIFRKLKHNSKADVVVIGHEERSLKVTLFPLVINLADSREINHFPGIGKKAASAWILNKPFIDLDTFRYTVDPGKDFENLMPHCQI